MWHPCREHADHTRAWEATWDFEHCLPHQPTSTEQWAIMGHAGAISRPHVDHGGLGTWLRILNGSKGWGLFDGEVDHGLLAEDVIAFGQNHRIQTIQLDPGNVL